MDKQLRSTFRHFEYLHVTLLCVLNWESTLSTWNITRSSFSIHNGDGNIKVLRNEFYTKATVSYCITHCDEPARLRPVAKLRSQVHLAGWSQSMEVKVGNRWEWGQMKPHPAQIQTAVHRQLRTIEEQEHYNSKNDPLKTCEAKKSQKIIFKMILSTSFEMAWVWSWQ